MPSNLYATLSQRINTYASIFIDENDESTGASSESLVRAVAFRVLSSAALEQYLEERCKNIAREGVERLRKGLPTSAGRALIVWYCVRNNPDCVPVHESDVEIFRAQFADALSAYLSSVRSNHGLNRKDAKALLYPVGLRAHHMPEELLDRLQALSERRDPAVHTASTRSSNQLAPSLERKQVEDILALLSVVDERDCCTIR